MVCQASCQAEFTTGATEALAEASETSFFVGVHPCIQTMAASSGVNPSSNSPLKNDDRPLVVVLLESPSRDASESIHRAGVFDLLCKPFDAFEARLVARRARRHVELLTETRRLRRELSNREGQVRMVGRS